MPQFSETIPDALKPCVDAALAWFNASADAAEDEFKVTGMLDADGALHGSDELRLVLCGGDRCEQRSSRVSGAVDAWEIDFADSAVAPQGAKSQAELDPPPGPAFDGSTKSSRNTPSSSCSSTEAWVDDAG